ncbi:MAG: alpha-amylase family glycosyl hydrolase, partial [Alkalispirochaeta sp.]
MSTSVSYTFGPEVRGDGRRVFRLWAPSATTVELHLSHTNGSPAKHSMRRLSDEGWFHSEEITAPGGTRYAFQIDENLLVPDPASRLQEDDVHGHSVVVESTPVDTPAWHNHSWENSVIYEAHVGTATPEGTFAALQDRLPYLAELGITVLELLPVSDFPGARNWGYDGVLPYAPDRSYGTPDDLKALISAAHHQGIAVWMDVVYNHFGPDGNYLHV